MSNEIIPKMSEIEEKNETKEQCNADYKTGLDFLKNGEITFAAHAFHNALMGCLELGDDHGVANAADKLADICLEREEYPQALKHIETAYAICEKEQDQSSMISLKRKIAQAKIGMKKYDEVLSLYYDLIDFYQGSLNPKGSVETMEKIAEVYILQENKSAAADTYRTIASIHKNFKHKKVAQEFLDKASALESEL